MPFYFYDGFMKHNGLYDDIEEMLADSDFQTDYDTKADELKKLRKKIKKAETPEWIETALNAMHATFPEGTSLRYRSSTNNEDLPNFNGAGLYDSKTQHPEETEEDGISKSLKQVYASMWNFRAFIERDFHRVDPPSGRDGGAGASQLLRRTGQRRGRQRRPCLRHGGDLLRQLAGWRGFGHQPGGLLGA